MRAHLHEPLTIPALPRQASLAERTLIRRFYATTGSTPVKWLTAQRVLHTRQLLETSELPVDQVASASGWAARPTSAATSPPPSAFPRAPTVAHSSSPPITKAVAYKYRAC